MGKRPISEIIPSPATPAENELANLQSTDSVKGRGALAPFMVAPRKHERAQATDLHHPANVCFRPIPATSALSKSRCLRPLSRLGREPIAGSNVPMVVTVSQPATPEGANSHLIVGFSLWMGWLASRGWDHNVRPTSKWPTL